MGDIITNWPQLSRTIERRRLGGETLVTTNGVFDLLHVGHIRYLQAANALGSLLIVAINSDACTRVLKGPTRPFVTELERAELLAALGCVDYVTLFDEPTPEMFLSHFRPDIHTKGGDYDIATMPETAVMERHGGKIVLLPFTEGRSTTDLAARIAAHHHR